MSTEVMSAAPIDVTNQVGGDGKNCTCATMGTSSVNLTLENDQLWSIIVKQRTTIKELELTLENLRKDRDMLLLVVKKQQPTSTPPSPTPTCSSPPSHEPVLPPRSPFRHHQQQSPRTQDGSITVLTASAAKSTYVGGTRRRPSSAAIEVSSSVTETKPVIATSSPLPSSSTLPSPPPLPPIHVILDEGTQHHGQKYPSHISRVLSQPNLASSSTVLTAPITRNFKQFFTNMNMIIVKVVDINVQQSLKNKTMVSFIISVHNKSLSSPSNPINLDRSLWRIKKEYSDFKALDALLRSHIRTVTNNKHTTMMKLEKLPEKAQFTSHITSTIKMDQKKKLIEKYLTRAIRLPLPETTGLIQFLSSDICEEQRHRSLSSNSPCQKEGYLSLDQDQSGVWNSYYFMLHGSTLDYYDSKDGSLIGSISLTDGHMTVQRPPSSGTGLLHASDRYTITITKLKRPSLKAQSQQITLKMGSEMELTGWVQALSTLAQPRHPQQSQSTFSRIPKVSLSTSSAVTLTKRASRLIKPIQERTPNLQQKLVSLPQNRIHHHDRAANRLGLPQRSNSDTSIYPDESSFPSLMPMDDDNDADIFLSMACMSDITPTATMTLDTRHPARHQHTSLDDVFSNHHYRTSKRESNPIPHTTTSTLYEATRSGKKDDLDFAKKAKHKLNRRTFWPKNIFSGNHNDTTGVLRGFLLSRHSSDDTLSASVSSSFRLTKQQRSNTLHLETKASTTVPLFGVPLSKASLISDIPSIAYRCIDFLEQRQAVYEEGIYRLSGSAVKIKALRREFEEKGDFDLLASEEYRNCDVHAVTGLLKLWLRELPGNILTEPVLKKVILIKDRQDCVTELGHCVAMLPLVNYNLLRALCTHLLDVTRNSGINKMTMRNMSIIISPTLGIPISIFNLFLCEFDRIFGTSEQQGGNMETDTIPESQDHLENGSGIKAGGSDEGNRMGITKDMAARSAWSNSMLSGDVSHQNEATGQHDNPTLSDSDGKKDDNNDCDGV